MSVGCGMPKLGSNVPHMENRSSAAGPFDRAAAAALRAAAAERQITQTTIAKESGIAPRTLARYMAGTSPIPVSKLVEVAAAIGVGAGEVIDSARVIAHRAEQNSGG